MAPDNEWQLIRQWTEEYRRTSLVHDHQIIKNEDVCVAFLSFKYFTPIFLNGFCMACVLVRSVCVTGLNVVRPLLMNLMLLKVGSRQLSGDKSHSPSPNDSPSLSVHVPIDLLQERVQRGVLHLLDVLHQLSVLSH